MTFTEKALRVTRNLQKSNSSEGIAIGDVLDSALDQGDLTPEVANGILDEFIGWAKDAKKELFGKGKKK